MADAHAGLEVDHTPSALQVDYSQACGRKILVDSDVAHFNTYKIFNPDVATFDSQIALEETKVQPVIQQRTCKLPRKKFWIIVATAIVVITAIVVGLGVRLAILKSKSEQAQSTPLPGTAISIASNATTSIAIPTVTTTLIPTTTPSTLVFSKAPSSRSTLSISSSTLAITKTTASSVSATTVLPPPGQTATLISDCPSSNSTLVTLDIFSFQMSFRKICGVALINSQGVSNSVSQAATSLDDCINMCASYNALNKDKFATGSASICNAVCWRNSYATPGEVYGWCFGYTTTNSSNALAYKNYLPCDAAAWIDQRFK